MADLDVKISQLPAATSLAGPDQFVILQSGATKRISQSLVAIPGPAGPAGPAGPTGPQGPAGPAGTGGGGGTTIDLAALLASNPISATSLADEDAFLVYDASGNANGAITVANLTNNILDDSNLSLSNVILGMSDEISALQADFASLSVQGDVISTRGTTTAKVNDISVVQDLYNTGAETLNNNDGFIYYSEWVFVNNNTVGGNAMPINFLLKVAGNNNFGSTGGDIVIPAGGANGTYSCSMYLEYAAGASQLQHQHVMNIKVWNGATGLGSSPFGNGVLIDRKYAVINTNTDYGTVRPSIEIRLNMPATNLPAAGSGFTWSIQRVFARLLLTRAAT
jgi:hypothetical protein